MTDHDEAIDRLLDQLAASETPNDPSLDSESISAAARLFAAGQRPQANQAFLNRLESILVEKTPAAAGGASTSRSAGLGIALQPVLPRWRPRAMLATAAILALVMLSALSVVRLGDSPNGGNATLAGVFQAASASAHSEESTCGDVPASIGIDLNGRALTWPQAQVVAGEPFTLSVANYGTSRCRFMIEELHRSILLEPGQSTTLSLNLEAGTYMLKINAPSGDEGIVAGVLRSIDANSTATPAP